MPPVFKPNRKLSKGDTVIKLRRVKYLKISTQIKKNLYEAGLIYKTSSKPIYRQDSVDHLFKTKNRDNESVLKDARSVITDMGLRMGTVSTNSPNLNEKLIAMIDSPMGAFSIFQKQ